jgi:hypothetical protein
MIEIPFSERPEDQMRLSAAGGYIHIKPNGFVVFRFDSTAAYQRYLDSKKQTA